MTATPRTAITPQKNQKLRRFRLLRSAGLGGQDRGLTPQWKNLSYPVITRMEAVKIYTHQNQTARTLNHRNHNLFPLNQKLNILRVKVDFRLSALIEDQLFSTYPKKYWKRYHPPIPKTKIII